MLLITIQLMILLLIFLICPYYIMSDNGGDWCYEGNCGPSKWVGKCKFGERQSPINIVKSSTVKSKPDRKLKFSSSYYEPHNFNITNTGKTIMLTLSTPNDELIVEGAGWKGQYHLIQMHFHWGSEHLINGQRFPLELHLVHEQINGKGGLGVLGILFSQSSNDNSGLSPIISSISSVQTKPGAESIFIPTKINLMSIMPQVWDIYRYTGSLTTPPCSEQILWSVFTQKIGISKTQLAEFYKVTDEKGEAILKNYRPVKPLVTPERNSIFWMPVNKNKMIKEAF